MPKIEPRFPRTCPPVVSIFVTGLLVTGLLVTGLLAAGFAPDCGTGNDAADVTQPAADTEQQQFDKIVVPFLKSYCHSCHGSDKQEGKLELHRFTKVADVRDQLPLWDLLFDRLAAGEMPPAEALQRPTQSEVRQVVDWIQTFRDAEAHRNSGDPGLVLARRLSNSEYDYTIQDLTGVDIRPTREFPVDPANEAGFDNSGESLTMSPALLKKYLEAARRVSEHLVLKPQGFVFAPHPVVTDTDRDKYCVHRIVDFYQGINVRLSNYLFAAWTFRHRDQLGAGPIPLEELAQKHNLSPKYLRTLWEILQEDSGPMGPLKSVCESWRELPEPPCDIPQIRQLCSRIEAMIAALRGQLDVPAESLRVNGISPGSQPLVLWKNRQEANRRRQYQGGGYAIGKREFSVAVDKPDEKIVLKFRTRSAVADPNFASNTNGLVIFREPAFVYKPSPKAKKGAADDKPRPDRLSLRTVLEQKAPDEVTRMKFGEHPSNPNFSSDSFVLAADASVTLTIPKPFMDTDSGGGEWTFLTEAQLDRRDNAAPMSPLQVDCYIDKGGDSSYLDVAAPYLFPPEHPAILEFRKSCERFCSVFPNEFRVVERGPYFDPTSNSQRRLLTAGFHLMQGYFRDDRPLCELILDDQQKDELDKLWEELDFIADIPARQYKDFIFFERAEPPRFIGEAEFDFARSEDKDAVSATKIRKLAEAYSAKAKKNKASESAIQAIDEYFTSMLTTIRDLGVSRQNAERSHLDALLSFTQKAYRRPLSGSEPADILGLYHELRTQNELSHEDAMRDTLTTILLSPNFSYRFDLAVPGESARPLTDLELASRLSYFLWSSMPDAELLKIAEAGRLRDPDVLRSQTKRMLLDPKIARLAAEFGGSWLEFRRFAQHNGVDRERFPTFTNELRQSMYEEPIHFLTDIFQNNGSIRDLIAAKHTFVNRELARFYGIPFEPPSDNGQAWLRVDNAEPYGRGGLLPMAAFLTSNSPGLRTSPVKRGYWVVRRLFGERIPPPPPDVPELPKDEALLGDRTLAQMLAAHRQHKSCAGCHQRFDSLGLVFEGYGPIGERRERDLGGRLVDSRADFPDGSNGKGLAGLADYVRRAREHDFLDNFSRKLLAFALGRNLVNSDRLLVDKMRASLAEQNFEFHRAVELIVTSPQFLNRRGG